MHGLMFYLMFGIEKDSLESSYTRPYKTTKMAYGADLRSTKSTLTFSNIPRDSLSILSFIQI